MNMGWMMTGDCYPRKWRKAWQKAWKEISKKAGTDTIPADLGADAELDLFRWAYKLAVSYSDMTEKQLEEVRKLGMPEILERPTRSLDSLMTLIFQVSQVDQK